MRVEVRTFDILDLSSGDFQFVARAFYDEAQKDLDAGYKSLALQEFEKAKMLFESCGDTYFAGRCAEQINEMNEEM